MSSASAPDPTRRRLLRALPFAGAAVVGAGFLALLGRMRTGTYDPHAVPDPRVGHAVPNFDLPPQPPGAVGFSSAELHATAKPVVINFFASWCVPCLQEAPMLLALQQQGVALWGIAYEDTVAATQGFLDRNGNPYARLARDANGQVAIDFGLYGVPESYFIDRSGIIRWRWTGPLVEDADLLRLQHLLTEYA